MTTADVSATLYCDLSRHGDALVGVGSEQGQDQRSQWQALSLGPFFDASPEIGVDVSQNVGSHLCLPRESLPKSGLSYVRAERLKAAYGSAGELEYGIRLPRGDVREDRIIKAREAIHCGEEVRIGVQFFDDSGAIK